VTVKVVRMSAMNSLAVRRYSGPPTDGGSAVRIAGA
jgi:hypothetical protein